MQMALIPNPWAAMLQGDQGWLRSRISPLMGFASSQKYQKAVRCRLSSRASVVRDFSAGKGRSRAPAAVAQGAAQASIPSRTRTDAGNLRLRAWAAVRCDVCAVFTGRHSSSCERSAVSGPS